MGGVKYNVPRRDITSIKETICGGCLSHSSCSLTFRDSIQPCLTCVQEDEWPDDCVGSCDHFILQGIDVDFEFDVFFCYVNEVFQ